MIILGIDPGLQITGYGVIRSNGVDIDIIEAGIIKTRLKDNFEFKLNEIYKEVGNIIRQFKPDYIAIEELYSHYAHPKTAIIMGRQFIRAHSLQTRLLSYLYSKKM